MKKDKKLIPKNTYYCYSGILDKNEKLCPYWSKIKGLDEQENGYCSYLGKGDYELNREERIETIIVKGKKERIETIIVKGKKEKIKYHKVSKSSPAIFKSLLWDQVKECFINLPKIKKG